MGLFRRESKVATFGTFVSFLPTAELTRVQLNDPDTSDTLYGVLGHSLGAGVSLLFSNVTVTPSCTVIIGGGMGSEFGGLSLPINESTPKNLMIASESMTNWSHRRWHLIPFIVSCTKLDTRVLYTQENGTGSLCEVSYRVRTTSYSCSWTRVYKDL